MEETLTYSEKKKTERERERDGNEYYTTVSYAFELLAHLKC